MHHAHDGHALLKYHVIFDAQTAQTWSYPFSFATQFGEQFKVINQSKNLRDHQLRTSFI